MYIVSPELLGCGNHVDLAGAPNEDSGLTRGNEDAAVDTIVNIDVGSDIYDEDAAVVTVIDIELLFVDRAWSLDEECVLLVDKSIVVWVVFLFYGFWFEDVRI